LAGSGDLLRLSHPGGGLGNRVTKSLGFSLLLYGDHVRTGRQQRQREGQKSMGILWIILIVILVLALLGFFSRGYW
jgi:hypothetical protein